MAAEMDKEAWKPQEVERELYRRFPQVKRLSAFHFEDAPTISATQIAKLAKGDYIDQAENVLFVGDSGTGSRCWPRLWAWPPASRGGRYGSPPSPAW
jgi:DNA replication protein DnaC